MSSTKRANNKLTLKKSATSKKPYINACGGGGRSILKIALEKPTKLSDGDVINLLTEDKEGHPERTIATTTTTTTNELEDFLKEYEGNFNHVYAPPITTIPPSHMRPPVIDPRHGQQQQHQQQLRYKLLFTKK
ncbi:uncharacterized protein LOC116182118 [Photinus pyralis]|uniref:uncharacterized protein LOC116182118 n=1 Tax=Photinus pyralis TaxID=7054 RepID=UPI001266FD29|nr:uncharacterized protein LOC116182118 [Photinus pyralis]